jgi:phage-related protein
VSQPLDVAYVELRARGEDDAAREVKRAVDDMERDVERASREMEADLTQAFRDVESSITKSIGDTSDRINASTKKVRKSVIEIGDNVIEVFEEVGDTIDDVAGKIGGGGGGGGGGGRGGLVSQLGDLGAQMRNLSALTPPPLLAALAAATPAIIALGGALLDLLPLALALPAGISTLVASVFTLQMAFSGVGDAVGALASGDLEKIEAAMAGLAPAAQAFARELFALQEPLERLQRTVQQSFFAPLQGDLTRLVNALLPTLTRGMSDLGAAFGELGSSVLDLLGSNDIVEDIGDVFESTARIVRNITPELTEFLGVLFGVIEAGLPFIERAFGALGDGLSFVSEFLSGSLQDGSFNAFLEEAVATLKDLGELTAAVFKVIDALFGEAGDEGRTFIQSLTDGANALADFLNSAEGQDALQRLLDSLPILVASLAAGLQILGALIVLQNNWLNLLEDIGGTVVFVARAIGDFFGALGGGASDAAGSVGDFFSSVGEFFSNLVDWAVDASAAVRNFVGQVVTFLTELPGRALDALLALPSTLGQLFTDALNQAAYIVGFAIGTIVNFFLQLPDRISAAFETFKMLVVSVLTTTRDQAIALVQNLADTVVRFFDELPERSAAAVTSIIERVRSIFTSTRDAGTNRIRELINSVTGFFGSLPGRITGALNGFKDRVLGIFRSIATSAYDIGRNIVNGIKNGIVDAIQGAVDLARNAAKRIVDGFKDALRTGSPSRVTEEEIGRPIMQGIGVGVREEEPSLRETINRVVGAATAPLGTDGASLPFGTGAGAGQVLNFAPGAVQVVFEGVVPTEAEATRTGNAVAQGIAQTLARQSARTAVRTR